MLKFKNKNLLNLANFIAAGTFGKKKWKHKRT